MLLSPHIQHDGKYGTSFSWKKIVNEIINLDVLQTYHMSRGNQNITKAKKDSSYNRMY